MLWMVEGGNAMEIRAEDDMHNSCYFSLASGLSLDYYYFLSEKSDAKKSTQTADFVLTSVRSMGKFPGFLIDQEIAQTRSFFYVDD